MNKLKELLMSKKFWTMLANLVVMLIIAFGGDADQAMKISAIIMAGSGMVAYIIGTALVDASKVKAISTTQVK